MDKLRVTVLCGGTSSEREVSLMSGARVMAALDPARYEARLLDLADIINGHTNELGRLLVAPSEGRPEVVFIALHGGAGENGTVQGMLELLDFPYTGSGVLASALALDKTMTKRILKHEDIPTPAWIAVRAGEVKAAVRADTCVGLPCVVKPSCEGSTIGLSIVRARAELAPALELAFRYGQEAIIEAFVPGIEITGAVIGNDELVTLPLIEIIPSSGFYDYEMKYTPGATEEIVPARLPEGAAERARELTLRTHRTLGCRGFSRTDMIVGPDDIYVLELNTIPGMTGTSLVPRAAEAAGISFPQLVDRLIDLAREGKCR